MFYAGGASNRISTFTDTIKLTLSLIKRWDDSQMKSDAQYAAVKDFITKASQCGMPLDAVQEQLQKLHSEELALPKPVFQKAQQLVCEEYVKKTATHSESVLTDSPESATTVVDAEPLFCKDTIYHASICSEAVCSYNAGDYQKFFKNKDLVPGHAFRAVSFSRSKTERFLIALKGESTYYFAFRGMPNLTDWPKGFKCFSEGNQCDCILLRFVSKLILGIMAQCKMFPVCYIIELLNKQCQVVLTGKCWLLYIIIADIFLHDIKQVFHLEAF